MFPDISFFTKIPTPPNPASFPDHHSSYLCHEVPTKRALWPFHLTSWMQHTSTFHFLSFSHTSVFLPQRLPTFNCTKSYSMIFRFKSRDSLHPGPFKSCRGLGATCIIFLVMGIVGAKFFYREHALADSQPQFSDTSGPTKQLSWQPHHYQSDCNWYVSNSCVLRHAG